MKTKTNLDRLLDEAQRLVNIDSAAAQLNIIAALRIIAEELAYYLKK